MRYRKQNYTAPESCISPYAARSAAPQRYLASRRIPILAGLFHLFSAPEFSHPPLLGLALVSRAKRSLNVENGEVEGGEFSPLPSGLSLLEGKG
jgi:hypothetical protein